MNLGDYVKKSSLGKTFFKLGLENPNAVKANIDYIKIV